MFWDLNTALISMLNGDASRRPQLAGGGGRRPGMEGCRRHPVHVRPAGRSLSPSMINLLERDCKLSRSQQASTCLGT